MVGPPAGPSRSTVDVEAIVVLGCKVRIDGRGRLRPGALERRVETAVLAYARQDGERTIVVASGGRYWSGLLEADVMARELVRRGVPEETIVRERSSLTTRDNARFTAAALEQRGVMHATVVTSEWHLPRALALFRRAGVHVRGVGALEPRASPLKRLWWWGRERLLVWAQLR
jgi:uncharacterized SAM-binding protein YcdF (DUF218 family)